MRCYGPRTSSCNLTVAAQEVKSVVLSDIGYFMVELQRAKLTSKAPLVRKLLVTCQAEKIWFWHHRMNVSHLHRLLGHLNVTCDFGCSQ